MNILAIDTTQVTIQAALSAPGGTFFFEGRGGASRPQGTGHTERLPEIFEGLLEEAGLVPEDLEALAVMEGPGSFTGLRIGYATAKGLSLALGIPIVAVPTLLCMAMPHAAWPGPVIPALDAKGGRFFAALYRAGERRSADLDAGPEELAARAGREAAGPEKTLLTGPGAPLLYEKLAGSGLALSLDQDCLRGHAGELLEISAKRIIVSNGGVFLAGGSGPVYLRKSGAERDAGGPAEKMSWRG